MRIKLTDELIRTGLQCPPGKKRIELVDISDAIGLYVEVRAAREGEGVYVYRYRSPRTGKTRHARIGRTTEVSLEDARHEAKRLRAKVTLGIDPQGDNPIVCEPDSTQQVPTFGQYWISRYVPHVRPRKRGWKKDQQMFKLRLEKEFGHLRLDMITPAQIQEFHTRLHEEEGLAPATCNRYAGLLRHALRLAVRWELIPKCPASNLEMFHEEVVVRTLTEDELKRLLTVLHTDANRNVCRILLWLIFTGARLNEALSARWQFVDRKTRTWRIPSSVSKGKRIRSVPLSDGPISILDEIDAIGRHDDYLFVNPRTNTRYKSIHKVFNRLRKAADLPKFRVHDTRHVFGQLTVSSGLSIYALQRVLGHQSPVTTQRYAAISAAAMQETADNVFRILDGTMRRSA